MAYTPLPTAPSRADAANFAARGDAFLTALGPFGAEMNANGDRADTAAAAAAASALTAANAPGTSATSATSVMIGMGSKSFGIQTGKALLPNMWVIATDNGNANNWMMGPILSYNSSTGALTINVQFLNGAGTSASWMVAHIPPIRVPEATKEQIWTGASSQVAFTPAALKASYATQPLTFASPLVLNGAAFFVGAMTVTGNIVLDNPVSLLPGQVYTVRLTMGGAGGFSLGASAAWEFPLDEIPVPSPAAGRTDVLRFQAIEGGKVEARYSQGFTL